KASGFVHAAKMYPAGATTNSDSGVTSVDKIFPVLEAMAEVGMPLLVHGEVTRPEIDVFDREKLFIDEHLRRVVERFPTLKVVFEHITTAEAVQFVNEAPANVGATITAQHLLYNRNHMLVGGIRPHFYCLPILKRNTHQAALDFTGIKLDHPLRMAVSEESALTDIFRGVRKALKANGCKRAILVGHNSSFDLGFLNAAVARHDMKRNPFHPFSSFDTATLAGLAYGQTVLARACQSADIDFDGREAHSARYDTEKTAELFC
uniref:Dihydroorotase n=1 Tax=Steinernema glaseri TaxID=37863 RepID=A0A1I8ANF5_9BILA